MIQVEHVSRYFGDVAAVNDVSFNVEKGEIVGFLGPNAAGKTTTMRILTTYLPATQGTAKIAGFDVHNDSMQVRKRIGYLPENPPLYSEMRVKDYLDFVAKIKGVDPVDRPKAVKKVIEQVGLTFFADRVIRVLSKGYKQRVGIAQALVHNPDVLILDEPTSGLDPNQISEVRDLIKSLAGNHTIILSTHILPEVSMTCERVVIINNGRVVAEDTPESLTKKYSGSTRHIITLQAPQEEAQILLSSVAGVDSIQAVSSMANQNTFYVESVKDAVIAPELAKAIVQKGWPLFEMKAEDVSLEDVFKHVTTEEGTQE